MNYHAHNNYCFTISQNYLDEVLCGNDPHAFTKPDPRNIFYICDKLNVNLKNTVMVGDSIGKCQGNVCSDKFKVMVHLH